jgi:L-iditol 2-dehydrogenase
MKVLRLHGTQDLKLHEEPLPVPGNGEVLIRVKAVGVCGSDLHWFAEKGIGDARLEHPLVLGHEFAGEIASGDQSGKRVAVDPAVSCGVCISCQHGHPNLCEKVIFAGHGKVDGALREYMTWPNRCLFPLPDNLSDEDGAVLEPLGVAIHAVDLAHLKPGMTVGVFGCGPIGLLILQLVQLSGAVQVIATDPLPHRLEAAKSFQADSVIQARRGEENAEIVSAAGGWGVDVAFEVAGENEAVETAIAVTRPGGRVILAGIPSDDRTSFCASTARRKGLTLVMVRRMKHTYPRAIRLVEKGLVDVRSLVTHRYPLEDSLKAFQMANERQGLKIVINPNMDHPLPHKL